MKKTIITTLICFLLIICFAACASGNPQPTSRKVVIHTYNPNATAKVLTSPEPVEDEFSFIVGTWQGSDNFGVLIFNADGTGKNDGDLAKYDFTYSIKDGQMIMDITFDYSPSNKPLKYDFEKVSDTEFTLTIDGKTYTFTKN